MITDAASLDQVESLEADERQLWDLAMFAPPDSGRFADDAARRARRTHLERRRGIRPRSRCPGEAVALLVGTLVFFAGSSPGCPTSEPGGHAAPAS